MADSDSSKQGQFWDTGEPGKRCTCCGERKPFEDFRMDGAMTRYGRSRKRSSWCRVCQNRKTKERWQKRMADPLLRRLHREGQKDRHLRRKFGLGLVAYRALLASQNGVCAICKRLDRGRELAVDHDHATGAIRGLLCGDCNMMLGLMQEDVSLLMAAVAYLKKARGE